MRLIRETFSLYYYRNNLCSKKYVWRVLSEPRGAPESRVWHNTDPKSCRAFTLSRTSVMSLHPHVIEPVPEETARVARVPFPKAIPISRSVMPSDRLQDEDFTALFPMWG